MTSGFEVDSGALDGIARTLGNASEDVDALGNSVPAAPDAGLGTPAITGILARLVDNAGQLVVGTAAAGEAVAAAARSFEDSDAQARDDLQNAAGAV